MDKNVKQQKNAFKKQALEYHSNKPFGKLEINPTKAMVTQLDLSLAYSPGVAYPCLEIVKNPAEVLRYTGKSNLVGVVTNGSAVLGLGNIGPLAAKPVMEGKAVLFKKFADLNAFDIELAEQDPDRFCDLVAAMEPTFGGINLEDIKSPECFVIEKKLRERMNIPIFHDDQHGTAIVTTAALINALNITNRKAEDIRVCTTGVGAAGVACLEMFLSIGIKRENIIACDEHGVININRKNLNEHKKRFAQKTKLTTLSEALRGADMFLGLSVGGIVTPEMVKHMAPNPILFCLANPEPEITPDKVKEVRNDAITATGRSDFVNQVNNVLCFPFMFRGALDAGATSISEGMKLACANAIAKLAQREIDESLSFSYAGEEMVFGKDYLLPKPFDPRLVTEVSPAVALAAMKDKIAKNPIKDFNSYAKGLRSIVSKTASAFLPMIEQINLDTNPPRLIFAEGEDSRVLRTAQKILENGVAYPILVGRRTVIEHYLGRLNLRIEADKDFEIIDPENDPRYREYSNLYHEIAGRRGISIQAARDALHTNNTVIASLLLRKGVGDAMMCGTQGEYKRHLYYIDQILGKAKGVNNYASISAAFLKNQTLFIADTHVHDNPTIDELIDITELAIQVVKKFGIVPKVALISNSNFGSNQMPCSEKMSRATAILSHRYPELKIDGEMSPDSALHSVIRDKLLSKNRLGSSNANILIMPSMETASVSFKLLMATIFHNNDEFFSVLAGCAYQAHIMTSSVSSNGLYNVATYINSVVAHKNESSSVR